MPARGSRAMARRLSAPWIVVVMVAACGGSTASPTAAPTPSPSTAVATATPAPTPSPSPADVSAAFVKAITAPDFNAAATISGTVTISGIEGTLSGDALKVGDADQSTTVIEIAGNKQTTDSIEVGPSSPGGAGAWKRQGSGPWVAQKPSTKPSLFESIAALSGIEDVGVVTKDGKSLHHLKPSASGEITPEALGFDVEGAKDPTFTMDLYATDDGTPAIIAINGSWTQVSDGTESPIDIDVEYAFSEPSATQTIVAPPDPWTLYTSSTFTYEMAHPDAWTVESAKDKDSYLLDGQPYVYVAPQKVAKSLTLTQFADALKKVYKPQFGTPTSVTDTRLDNQPAKRLIFEFTNKAKQDVTLVDDVAVRDSMGWEVFVATTGGTDDIPIFDQFVSTFHFTD
jgi:hypothetical protein